ncbi:MAG: outer membrane beta-barrel protein [Labilibaculum sp.]|nr:outer membrane beta-barrel protein [Labilibaculum sp.]MBI9058798.1 outer membrane beta-barrel protein [Labilibaculum sp.]
MLNDNKHIDGLFADGLKNLSVPPNPKVWEGVSGQMLAAKKRRLFAIYIWTGLAASILLLLAIGNRYLTDQPNYNMQLETLTENTSSNEGKSEANTNNKQVDQLNGASVEKESNISNKNNVERLADESRKEELAARNIEAELREKKNDVHLSANAESRNQAKFISSNTNSFEALIASKKENKNPSFLDREFIKLLANSEESFVLANAEFDLPTQLLPNTSQFQQEPSLSLLADEIQIQKNLLAIEQLKQKEIKENRWSVIGQVSSSFSSYSGDSKGSNAEKGIWSLGGGAKVNYAMNEKIAFQTGIVYNRFGQDMSSGGGGGLLYADAPLSGEENMERVAVYPAQTSAGAIKLSAGNAKDAAMNEYTSSYVSSDYLIQTFKSIEIPFLMRYNLVQKRVGMFVSGGLSANLIVGNGVYDQSEGNRKIGEIDGIRTTNFSSQFSFGLEYRLSPKLQIGLEPSMKYYLNSINKSNQYQYKPYSIGIFTGIRYDF